MPATLKFVAGVADRRVFTPISSALANLPNGPGTILVLTKTISPASGRDRAGLTDSTPVTANWYHALSTTALRVWDDNGTSVITGGSSVIDGTDWWLYAISWPAGASQQERFHYKDLTTGGAWTHENVTTPTNSTRAGPGTGGWFRIGAFDDAGTDGAEIGLVAVWAGVQLQDADYTAFSKTSDLWNLPAGRPTLLVECTSLTPTDLTGGSTYSAANSTAASLTLTGSSPPWTFDQLGPATATSRPVPRPLAFRLAPWLLPQPVNPSGVTAPVQVEATGSAAIVLADTAIPTVSARGSSAIVLGATAVPTVSGVASSAITLAATAVPTDNASASSAIVLGATAIPTVQGISSSAVTFTAVAVPTDSATGSSAVVLGATGVPTVQGITSSPVTFTATAVPTVSASGQSDVVFTATGTATSSGQVEATGSSAVVLGATAVPTVSATATTPVVFTALAVPTIPATAGSSIIINATGTATTPGGITRFMAMRGVNSAFVNVASATTDAAFTGGIIPAAKAGQCVNVLAVTFNADTAADTLVFNSKGAGAGTAISALFSNPINGSVVWPYAPPGWFTTNGGEALTVTTTGTSPTHVQLLFEYINA